VETAGVELGRGGVEWSLKLECVSSTSPPHFLQSSYGWMHVCAHCKAGSPQPLLAIGTIIGSPPVSTSSSKAHLNACSSICTCCLCSTIGSRSFSMHPAPLLCQQRHALTSTSVKSTLDHLHPAPLLCQQRHALTPTSVKSTLDHLHPAPPAPQAG